MSSSVVICPVLIGFGKKAPRPLTEAAQHDGEWWAPLSYRCSLARWLANGKTWQWLASLKKARISALAKLLAVDDIDDPSAFDGLGLDSDEQDAISASRRQVQAWWEQLKETGSQIVVASVEDFGEVRVWLNPCQPNVVWVPCNRLLDIHAFAQGSCAEESNTGSTTDASSSESSPHLVADSDVLVPVDPSPGEVEDNAGPLQAFGKPVQWRQQRGAYMARVKTTSGKWLTKSFPPASRSSSDMRQAEQDAWSFLSTLV